MSEHESVGGRGLVMLGILFAVVAVLIAVFGHLTPDKILEETFAAVAEATMSVVVVGAVVLWYQGQERRRDEKRTLLRELTDIRTKLCSVNFLMSAHESAKTWTEQTRDVVSLIPRIDDLRETAKLRGLADPIDDELETALTDLETLKKEYLDKHGAIDKLSTQWDAILRTAPESAELLITDRARLMSVFDRSIHRLKNELRA